MTCLGVSETACALVVGWFVVVVSGTVAVKVLDATFGRWLGVDRVSWGEAFWFQAALWGIAVATWLFMFINHRAAGGGLG